MSQHLLVALAPIALFFGISPAATAADAATTAPSLQAAVTAAVQPTMTQQGIPGLAVVIHEHGQRHYFNYGVASKVTGQPISADTLFEIGSVSKLYGATLAAYATTTGKLSLSSPVSRYVPQLAGSAFDHITVLQAGTYAAGGLPMQFPDSVIDDAGALQWLNQWKPTWKPGIQRVYSNPSIALLGMAAAGSLQQPCNEAIEHTLTTGLQLRQTWVDVPAGQQANLAQGHNKSGEVPHQHYPACAGSWGALKTSSTGLMDFLEAQLNPGKLTPDWQRAIGITQTGWYRTPLMLQGLGWEIYPWPVAQSRIVPGNSSQMSARANAVHLVSQPQRATRSNLLNKTGGTNGFSSYVLLLPERDIAIALLANKSDWPREERVHAALTILRALDTQPR